MKSFAALSRSMLAFLVLPGVVAFALPALLAAATARGPGSWFGCFVAGLGTASLVWCAVEFHRRGQGTLAPWAPPRRLVTHGLYAVSRNPMYLSVLLLLAGWALALRSVPHAVYAAIVAIGFHLRVVLGEEPGLERAFGAGWLAYGAAVPRWLPAPRRWPAGLCLGVGVLFGAALWSFSPALLGHAEPWDAALPLWSLSWFVIGAAGAATRHLRGLLLPVGDAVGQTAVALPQLARSEFGVLGLGFIGAGLAVALGVALLLIGAVALRQRLSGSSGNRG